MKASITKSKKLFIILFWLLIWHLLSKRLNSDILLVSPFAVALNIVKMVQTFEFYKVCALTFVKIFLGFLSGFFIGCIFALFSYKSRLFYEFISPLIATIKSIPVASFVVLVLVWVSSKHLSTVVSCLIVIPVVFSSIYQGLNSVPKDMIIMSDVFKVPFYKRFKFLYLGYISKYLASAISVGIGFCFKSGIAAEVIGISKDTIGEAIYTAKISFETVDVLSWTVIIIFLSIATEKLVSLLVKAYIKEN